ncbi:MAG TPA: glycosyltransferase [Longimicrobiales bacterium]
MIHPSIDPLSHKNRDLSLHKLVGVLSCSDLVEAHWPLMCPPFPQRARRLQADGSLRPATTPDDFGLLARPIITQVSRWDRLKGFGPLLDAFVQLKIGNHAALRGERHGRRLQIVRLVLAGADPDSIPDDPEAHAVFAELRAKYCALSPEVQQDIAVIALPIESRKNNALMVNALQRAADIIVQNSLREGFGLTVAEGMWKRSAVLGSAAACGVRLQVRDGVDGRLIHNPENVSELTEAMVEMLADPLRLEEYGRNAQYRVHDQFLIFSELRQWLGVFNSATLRT